MVNRTGFSYIIIIDYRRSAVFVIDSGLKLCCN